jgi:hypothetical protein
MTLELMDVMELVAMALRVSVGLEVGKNFGLGVRKTVAQKINDIAYC